MTTAVFSTPAIKPGNKNSIAVAPSAPGRAVRSGSSLSLRSSFQEVVGGSLGEGIPHTYPLSMDSPSGACGAAAESETQSESVCGIPQADPSPPLGSNPKDKADPARGPAALGGASFVAAFAAFRLAVERWQAKPGRKPWEAVGDAYDVALGHLDAPGREAVWQEVKAAQFAVRTGASAEAWPFYAFHIYRSKVTANWKRSAKGKASQKKRDTKRAADPVRKEQVKAARARYRARQKALAAECADLFDITPIKMEVRHAA